MPGEVQRCILLFFLLEYIVPALSGGTMNEFVLLELLCLE
jgi:hypothetical protein